MRRVQVQRRALEDQYGFSGKGAQGAWAVSAPVITQVPVAKTSEPPPAVRVKTHVATVAPVEVPAEVPSAEPIVKEIPVTDAIKDDVLKAAEDLTEAPVEPPIEEPAVIKEAESVTDPVTEVTASIDEPLPIPIESEIQVEHTVPVATETHVVAEPIETPEHEVEAVAESPAEESVVEPEEKEAAAAETIAAVKPPTETLAPDIEPVVEASVDINKPVVEVVEEPVVELEATSVKAEPVDIHTVTEVTEGAHATSELENVPVEDAVEQELEQQTAPLEEPTPPVESSCGPVAEGFITTESFLAVEAAIAEKQIPETTTEAPEVSSQMLAETVPAPESVLMPKEINSDLSVDGSLTVDTINGCLAGAEVAIEG